MENTDLETFMVKLRRLLYENYDNNTTIGNNPFIQARKHEIQLLYEELGSLIGSCFKDEDDLEDVGNWKTRLIEAAQEAEDTVDMFISSAIITNDDDLQLTYRRMTDNLLDCSLKDLKGVMDTLKSIRADMSNKKGNLFQNHVNRQDIMSDNKFEANGNTRVNLSSIENEEVVVGFEEDALLILDRLTADRKKLDIISIVGMGGQGKTTLANKIFNDSLVKYHFHVRGWVIVSQAYSTRDLLSQLMVSIGKSVHESASESKLCEMLYQSLKGIKYLIVMDDIWSSKAWDNVGICFPDDKTGSRVLLTTRLTEVAWHASQGGFIHNLGHLTKDQSWYLLCKKTFRGSECPESLIETGKDIAKKCGGLPLALVVIAGVLEKGDKREDSWEEIAKSVGSYIINDPNGCSDVLALSYDHLPSHLKKCFLYIGGFPKDCKFQLQRLICLWMAEEFIKRGQRSLEEEGEYYLMDLIDRNLLIVADRSSSGGVKSCRLHDLLRELCLTKASEENFFKKVSMPTSNNSLFSMMKQRRLFTDCKVLPEIYSHNFVSYTSSVLCFDDHSLPTRRNTGWVLSFLLLRVLDLQNILLSKFSKIKMLVHLRYLAFWSYSNRFSFSKAQLWRLQTLIVKGRFQSFMISPDNMVNLRHLRCGRINISNDFSVPILLNLQTISKIILGDKTQFLLESFPHIKKLGCSISSTSNNCGLLNFSMLTHLEALTIDTYTFESRTLANPIRFPGTLKKLTLSGFRLPWNHMSAIQQLPKLEVLKLLDSSFNGHLWETGDDQYLQLKYLKLAGLDIRVWEASSINFPRLKKLAVISCKDLSKIPLALGNISTLEQIEIDPSNNGVLDSVNRIQEVQHELGNYDIHVNFYCRDDYSRLIRSPRKFSLN
ncbi:putative late blight resistance protein homolog R1A-3 [Bidens hawaiensis]|uniref:putative late blight resistance protein homolog R1A-3 n=1 Tax=Bidens hawaiensis TaxID=980011 RepID=UPI00404B5A2A